MAHPELSPEAYCDVVRRALDEDLGETGDITTEAIVSPDRQARATLVSKSACVVAGLPVVGEVFYQVDSGLRWTPTKEDGDLCRAGDTLGRVAGAARSILSAERTALNFLQHLSGVATLARRFVDMAGGAVVILDTRKTLPTLRALEKYAVACGGARNHRAGLYDGVIVKDNHIHVAGSVGEAVRRVREHCSLPIEVEAQSLREVEDALAARADVIMLDNLPDDRIPEAVRLIGGRARVEVSGGMTLQRVGALAHLGVDCISVGALTHSAPAVDISLEIEV